MEFPRLAAIAPKTKPVKLCVAKSSQALGDVIVHHAFNFGQLTRMPIVV